MAAKWGDETIPDPNNPEARIPVGPHLNLPVVYFTQLMGLAFGMSEKELGLHRGFAPMPKLAPCQTVAA
jgi:heterodisulfide reductase subunit B